MTPDEQIAALKQSALALVGRVVDLKEELAAAQAELRGIRDDAGTPLAISDGLWKFAREECGHNPSSARHALSTVIDWVQQAKVKLAEAQAEISRLNLQSEHDDEYAGILARKCDSLRDRAEKAETALAGMTSRAEEAEGRLTAARLDTERLDFVARHVEALIDGPGHKFGLECSLNYEAHASYRQRVREHIDAARAKDRLVSRAGAEDEGQVSVGGLAEALEGADHNRTTSGDQYFGDDDPNRIHAGQELKLRALRATEPKVTFSLMEMRGEVDEHGKCPNCANPPHEGLCHRKEPYACDNVICALAGVHSQSCKETHAAIDEARKREEPK